MIYMDAGIMSIWALVGYAAESDTSFHYENTPIQIYRKFHLLKLKIFR